MSKATHRKRMKAIQKMMGLDPKAKAAEIGMKNFKNAMAKSREPKPTDKADPSESPFSLKVDQMWSLFLEGGFPRRRASESLREIDYLGRHVRLRIDDVRIIQRLQEQDHLSPPQGYRRSSPQFSVAFTLKIPGDRNVRHQMPPR